MDFLDVHLYLIIQSIWNASIPLFEWNRVIYLTGMFDNRSLPRLKSSWEKMQANSHIRSQAACCNEGSHSPILDKLSFCRISFKSLLIVGVSPNMLGIPPEPTYLTLFLVHPHQGHYLPAWSK